MYTNNNYPYYSKSKSIVNNGVQYAKWNTRINYGFHDFSLMYQYILDMTWISIYYIVV